MSPSSAQPQGFISPRKSPEKISSGFCALANAGKSSKLRKVYATISRILVFGHTYQFAEGDFTITFYTVFNAKATCILYCSV